MPTAATTDSGELVYADRVDPSAGPFYCIGCADSHEVSFIESHTRRLEQGSTTVSAHFRHTPNSGGGGGGGGPAESDIHRQRKAEALGVAMDRYDYAAGDLETAINGKRPDAYLEFENPHDRFGRGFAIEYQHKNDSKDLEASFDAFADAGYTTLVLTEDQFPDDWSGVPDIDLLGGTVVTPFPRALPDDAHHFDLPPMLEVKLDQNTTWMIRRTAESRDTQTEPLVPARTPPEWHDKKALRIWNSQPWNSIFEDGAHYEKHLLSGLVSDLPLSPPRSRRTKIRDDSLLRAEYESIQWSGLFNHPAPELPTKQRVSVDATFYMTKWLGQTNRIAGKTEPTPGDDRTWETIDMADVVPGDENLAKQYKFIEITSTDEIRESYGPISLRNEIQQMLVATRGLDDDPDPPSNPFDDVQCRNCGYYWHHSSFNLTCPRCGDEVDWAWNVGTNRISKEVVPDHIIL